MPTDHTYHDTHVRGVDPSLWQRLRMAALRRRVSLGQLLNTILQDWLVREEPL